MKVKIKPGSTIAQDHRFFSWPGCCPPSQEFDEEELYQYRTKYPDAEFIAEYQEDSFYKPGYWVCRRDGYGMRPWVGERGAYGNGSIIVSGTDSVEIVEY